MSYCADCGNTGVLIDGTPCHCSVRRSEEILSKISSINIPEQYEGLVFNPELLPDYMGDKYRQFMKQLFDDILSRKFRNRNICICSPIGTGKTVLAYTIIRSLFKQGIAVETIYDAMEIKRILLDSDYNREQFYGADPKAILESEYLFVRIPITQQYDSIPTLLDRRVRRGKSTIFLYSGNYNYLIKNPYMEQLKGSGSFGSIKFESFYPKKEEEK